MAERFAPPFLKFTTDTLKSLPYAKLYFYKNGTTTPQNTYQNVSLSTPHTNPVIADSAGNFAAIFLDGTYTVKLTDNLNVVQTGWPVDDVGGEQISGQFDDYSAINNYGVGDLVTGSDGQRYESQVTPNLNNDPIIAGNRPAYWVQIHLKREYDSAATYEIGQRVIYNNIEYVAKVQTIGHTPATGTYWSTSVEFYAYDSTKTYASGDVSFVGYTKYISQQAANLNHTPTSAGDVWWKPEWMVTDGLTKVKYLSGGGTLSAYFDNWLIDSNSYALPAAASVPANGVVVVTKSDKYRAQTPTVTLSPGDHLEWSGADDTGGLQLLTTKREVYKFISDGVNAWRIG